MKINEIETKKKTKLKATFFGKGNKSKQIFR